MENIMKISRQLFSIAMMNLKLISRKVQLMVIQGDQLYVV